MREPYLEIVEVAHEGTELPYKFFVSNTTHHGYITDAHWHDFIEILYFLEGSAQVLVNSEWIPMQQGDMVIFKAREVHAVLNKQDEPVKYFVLQFDIRTLQTVKQNTFEAMYYLPFIRSGDVSANIFYKSILNKNRILHIFENIYHESIEKEFGYELSVRSGILGICLFLLRQWRITSDESVYEYKSKIDIEILHKLFEYIKQNYALNMSLPTAAQIRSMSCSHFSREFKKITGKTFKEHVNFIRISEAERLLLCTNKPITEIAQDTGFATSSYFIEQFKNHKGLSPYQYRLKFVQK